MPYLIFRLLIFLGLVLTTSSILFAQDPRGATSFPIEINGQVRFAKGGAPAESVRVRIDSISGGTVQEMTTDRTGKFRFAGLQRAQYVVSIHAPGFKDAQQHVDLQTATSDYVLFQLTPDETAVTAKTTGKLIDANAPVEAQKEFDEGRYAIEREQKVEGISHLERAVQIYPDYFLAQLLLGTTYMDTRQWEKAERALRRTLEINPKSSAALFALGEVSLRQKKYADAERALQDGLKLDERSWQGHFALGRVYWGMGNISKAGPQVGRALQLKPDLAEGHLLAGNILLRVRQPENALVEFEEYLRLAPKGEFSEQARATAQKIRNALAEKKR